MTSTSRLALGALLLFAGCVGRARLGVGPVVDGDGHLGVQVQVSAAAGMHDTAGPGAFDRALSTDLLFLPTDRGPRLHGRAGLEQAWRGPGLQIAVAARVAGHLVGERALGPGLGVGVARVFGGPSGAWRALGLWLECDAFLVRGADRRALWTCGLPVTLEDGEARSAADR